MGPALVSSLWFSSGSQLGEWRLPAVYTGSLMTCFPLLNRPHWASSKTPPCRTQAGAQAPLPLCGACRGLWVQAWGGGLLVSSGPCDLDACGEGIPLARAFLASEPWPDLWAWVLARIYDPELLFISSGSRRFGWEVFQFPPGLDQTAQISKGKMRSPLLSALRARGVLQPHSRLLPGPAGT